MSDPSRLLCQQLDQTLRLAFEAAKDAEPPPEAQDQVWNALSVALPAGVLLGVTTAAHAAPLTSSAQTLGVGAMAVQGAETNGASAVASAVDLGIDATVSVSSATASTANVVGSGAAAGAVGAASSVGDLSTAAAVVAKGSLGLIAAKSVAIGLGIGLSVHAMTFANTRTTSERPAIATASPKQMARPVPNRSRHTLQHEEHELQLGQQSASRTDPKPSSDRVVEPKASNQLAVEEPTPDELREESALLSHVRQAVNASNSRLALRLIAEHQRRFAGGRLIQERDALEIQALAQHDEAAKARARARAKDFLARYPQSPYRETIAAVLTRPE